MQLNPTAPRSTFMTLLLIAPFFLWGTAMVAMKGVLPQTSPFFLAGVRLVPAGVLVLIAAAILGKPQPQGWAAWLWIGGFACVDGTLFQGFLAQGLMRTGAGLGSVMIDSQPLVVALLALWLFGEKIGPWGWLGLALGVLGISLLGLPEAWINSAGMVITQALTTGHWPIVDQTWPDRLLSLFDNGQWLMLLAALAMAIGTVMSRYVCRHADPVAATGWHMILGGVPLFVLSSQFETNQWVHLDVSNWIALAYATIFGSAIAYGLFFYFAASGSLTSFSSLTFLTPVFALLFGNLFLSEVLNQVQWVGVCLTLVSIYLINQRDQLTARFKQQLEINPDCDRAIENNDSLTPLTRFDSAPLPSADAEGDR